MNARQTASEFSLDAALRVLSGRYRRQLLGALLASGPAGSGEPVHPSDIYRPTDDPRAFELEMHHTHLPQLADADYIEWDRDTDLVWRGPRFDDLRPLLEMLWEHRAELPDTVF